MHKQTEKNVTVTMQKYWLYKCAICQISTTGMFVHWSSITAKRVLIHRKVRNFDLI